MTSLRNWYKGVRVNGFFHTFMITPYNQKCSQILIVCPVFFFFKHQGDDPDKSINPLITGMFGAVAGAVSVFGNTPLDVIKTRMQVGFNNRVTALEKLII